MSVQNVFSPVASRVVRSLLVDPGKAWSILSLSKEIRTGYGHTYRVVKTLLRMGLCRNVEANKVAVVNAGELLTRWASYFDFASSNKVNAYYSLHEDIDSFLQRLGRARKQDLRHALTLHVGAALVSPYVRPANIHLYVESQTVSLWQKLLDLKFTELGGNVFLVEPYDEGVFYKIQNRKGLPIVSNIQLYVDLYNYPARGREAAQHLRKEVIGF